MSGWMEVSRLSNSGLMRSRLCIANRTTLAYRRFARTVLPQACPPSCRPKGIIILLLPAVM